MSLRKEIEITWKLKDEIKKSKNNILKKLTYPLENSLRDDHNVLSAEITSDGENTIWVQPAFHGLHSDRENIDPKECFIGVKPSVHEISFP